MSETKKTHWRTWMSTEYLNGDELPDNGIDVTISNKGETELYSKSGGKKEKHKVLIFKEFKKPMIMTKRKANQITQVLGSKFIEDWIGKKITIFPREEKHGKEWFPVINVKSFVITKKVMTHEQTKKASAALASGKSSIEAIEKHYILDDATKARLIKVIPEKK